MINFAQIGIIMSGNKFDPDYQVILNRATDLGYTLPSTEQQYKHNQLMLLLKSSGVWNELDAIYVHANDGSKEFGTINWKNPSTGGLIMISSPSWTSNQGFNSNGTSSRLGETLTLSKYKQNSASYGFYFHTGGNTTSVNQGLGGFQDRAISFRKSDNTLVFRLNSLNSTSPSILNQIANNSMYGVKRTSSSQLQITVNGVSQGNISDTSQSIISSQFEIMYMFYYALSSWKFAMSFVGSGSLDQASLYSAFNTYLSNPS